MIALISFLSFHMVAAAESGRAATLNDAFKALQAAPAYRSTVANIRSIEEDFAGRDLVLAPRLEASAVRLNERRMFLNPSGALRARTDTFSLGLTKPFSTGTEVSVMPSLEHALTPTMANREPVTFDWQISLNQNLWQDAFGRATRLRRTRESQERRQQLAQALQARAQLLVEMETLYWDWAMAIREAKLRAKNVERGLELLKWIRGRFARSAAESSDVIQAEALLAKRRLDLMTIEQQDAALRARMERYVPGASWRPDPTELAAGRDLESLTTEWPLEDGPAGEARVRLETLAARHTEQALEAKASEVRDQVRPSLQLQLAYGKNAVSAQDSRSLRESFSEPHDRSTIGLVLTTGLDLADENRKVEAARSALESARLRREALDADAQVAWAQLKVNVRDLVARVDQAGKLATLQSKKAEAEHRRFRLGRSTAFQAITFEQDAADAEIALWSLYAQTRKMEAQARLFAR